MATTPNKKPVPSEDYVNMRFNAGKFDEFMTSTALSYVDRLGITHPTILGVKDEVASAAAASSQSAAESADEAAMSAAQAQGAAQSAEAIADGGTTFATTAEGIAATISGQSFRTYQDVNGFALFMYYQNVNGLAVFKGSQPGNEATEQMIKLLSSVVYSSGNEFDTEKEYPTLDVNNRILSYWAGNIYNILGGVNSKNIASENLNSTEIHTQKLFLDGYQYPTQFTQNNGEYDDDVVFVRVDINNRIMELITDKEYLTSAQQIGNRVNLSLVSDGEFETDFNYAMVDVNHRVIIMRNSEGVITGGVENNNNNEESVIFIGEVVLDGSKLIQFHADTGDQTIFATSSTLSNVLNVIDKGYFQFTDSADADAIGQLLYSPYGTYDPRAKFGRKSISFYGHSFEGNNQKLSGDLYNLTGMKVYNFARSGALSRSIALRNDAYRLKYTPVGGVIPASGSVDFIEADAGPLEVLGSPAISDQLQVIFSDVRGYVTWNGAKMTFTRATPGDAVTVPQAAELIVLPYTSVVTSSVAVGAYYPGAHEAIHVLWIGRNNINYIAQIQSDLVAIVERIRSQHKRFVLCPEFTQTTETTGTTGYNAVYAVNAMYKSLYPENYCEIDGVDLLQNFRSNYNPSLPDDVSAYNAGTVPPSLINTGDTLHPNNAGIAINAAFINQFLIKKGWN